MSKPALSIDVISDVVCPWCFIGKRRLEGALDRYAERFPAHPAPRVRWWPYQLNPDMPVEGVPRSEYLAQKFGSANVSEIYARVAGVGKEVGIPFAFDKMVRQPNTLIAHTLIGAAEGEGCQDALVEALFNAYFIEAEDLTRADTLARIAGAAGLSGKAIETSLSEGEARARTAHGDAQTRSMGVQGVPFFIFNQRLAVSGAQPEDMLLEAMTRALEAPAAA